MSSGSAASRFLQRHAARSGGGAGAGAGTGADGGVRGTSSYTAPPAAPAVAAYPHSPGPGRGRQRPARDVAAPALPTALSSSSSSSSAGPSGPPSGTAAGAGWTMMDEIREYQARVAVVASELEMLQNANKQLVGQVMNTNIVNESLSQRLTAAEADMSSARAAKEKREQELAAHVLEQDKLHDQIAARQPKVDATSAECDAADAKAAEHAATLTATLQKMEDDAAKRITELHAEIQRQKDALKKTNEESEALRNVKLELADLTAEMRGLKQQLVQAKAFTLHKSLSQTIRDSRTQTDKLRNIISHVQTEKRRVAAELAGALRERELLQTSILRLRVATEGTAGKRDTGASRPTDNLLDLAGSLSTHATASGAHDSADDTGDAATAGSLEASPLPSRADDALDGDASLADLIAASGPDGAEGARAREASDAMTEESLNAMAAPVRESEGAVVADAWVRDVQAELARLKEEARELHLELEEGAGGTSWPAPQAGREASDGDSGSGDVRSSAVPRVDTRAAESARDHLESEAAGSPEAQAGAPDGSLASDDDLYESLAQMNARLQAELQHVANVQAQLQRTQQSVAPPQGLSPSLAARLHSS